MGTHRLLAQVDVEEEPVRLHPLLVAEVGDEPLVASLAAVSTHLQATVYNHQKS